MQPVFAQTLGVRPGITAIVGSGGKTSLLWRLGKELSSKGRVLLLSTARMFPFPDLPLLLSPSNAQIHSLFLQNNCICIGDLAENGKLTYDVRKVFSLLEYADFVLVEADGSKHLPLKAHAPYEPIIPQGAYVINLLGVDGIGGKIGEICHRPELYAGLLEADFSHIVTPENAAFVINLENLGDIVLINKADTDARIAISREIAQNIRKKTAISAVKEGTICLF